MAQLYGVDISQFQGNINWDELNAHANFVIIRVGDGTIEDTSFVSNQNQARREAKLAGPLGIGYYYFSDPTLLDAITSANWFVDTLGPLQEGEVIILDLEGKIGPNPVAWAHDWLKTVEARTSTKPLIYLNQSEVKSYNWSPIISEGYGLWLAEYDGNKAGPGVETPWPVTAIRQWTDADVVQGIAEKVDGDVFYGDINAFQKYGYHAKPVVSPLPPVVQQAPQSESIPSVSEPTQELPNMDQVEPVSSPTNPSSDEPSSATDENTLTSASLDSGATSTPQNQQSTQEQLDQLSSSLQTSPYNSSILQSISGIKRFMSKYSKAIVAVVGAFILWLGHVYNVNNEAYQLIVSIATALGVYSVPNV